MTSRPFVLIDLVEHVERPVPDLRAEVVGKVHRAVEVEVVVLGAVVFVDAFRQLEDAEFARDRNVRHHVAPADHADGRDGSLGLHELRVE